MSDQLVPFSMIYKAIFWALMRKFGGEDIPGKKSGINQGKKLGKLKHIEGLTQKRKAESGNQRDKKKINNFCENKRK